MGMDCRQTVASSTVHVRADAPIRPAGCNSAAWASFAGPPGWGRRNLSVILLLAPIVFALGLASAQTARKTVRHHQVAVDDPSSPPELIQAENAIEKKDYPTAEPLLKKGVEDDPANYAAWFDLGFVYNALDRTEDAVAAYRKSVAAKPAVFESNLNLGLTLAKA